MKQILVLLAMFACLVLVSGTVCAQSLLLEENFGYTVGDTLGTAQGWSLNSNTSGPALYITSGSLSYSGYPTSGVGSSVNLVGLTSSTATNGQDLYKPFSQQTSGTIYASFLMSVSGAPASADYFFHFTPSAPSGKYQGRLYIKSSGAGFQLGLTKTGASVQWISTVYDLNTTYLIVLKYTIVTDVTSTDDYCQLFVNPSLSGTEPASADATTIDAGADAAIGAVMMRQGQQAWAGIQIDGIRVATSWSLAPLPVELGSFTASANRQNALLKWTTATETNCFGFEIQRATVGGQQSAVSEWQKVGFVNGTGTSSAPHNYSFTDSDVPSGMQTYRIKQIDRDGSSKIMGTARVEISSVPKVLTLGDNYPNPFNPSTKVSFTVPTDGRATLRVFNIVGQEVATLYDGVAVAGQMYTRTFDASRIASGVYFSRLDFGSQHLMHKMMLVK